MINYFFTCTDIDFTRFAREPSFGKFSAFLLSFDLKQFLFEHVETLETSDEVSSSFLAELFTTAMFFNWKGAETKSHEK